MSLAIVTAPTTDPVALADVKAFARVDQADEDAVVTAAIKAVTAWLAGPDGWLGRSLCDQTLELTVFDPCGPIVLPRPPILAVQSIAYPNALGALTTMTAGSWRTWTEGDGLTRVGMPDGYPWPSFLTDDPRLVVTYTAGYGTALQTPRQVDPLICQGIVALAARIFDDRDTRATLADPTARDMFAPFRVMIPETDATPFPWWPR